MNPNTNTTEKAEASQKSPRNQTAGGSFHDPILMSPMRQQPKTANYREENKRLTDLNNELLADKKRLDWLQNNSLEIAYRSTGNGPQWRIDGRVPSNTLREAIDAAITRAEGK